MNRRADKMVAIFGEGISALLNAYYLQRFGIGVDVYLSGDQTSNQVPHQLISTWLCLHEDTQAITTAIQGIAELREILIDIGLKASASEAGTTIFECRPDHVNELKQFAQEYKNHGLLVEFSTNIEDLSLPVGTLAAARFKQDVSISRRNLKNFLAESIMNRGGTVSFGFKVEQLKFSDPGYQMADHNGDIHCYDSVVLSDQDMSDVGRNHLGRYGLLELTKGISGRCLSFERASNVLKQAELSSSAQTERSLLGDLIRAIKSRRGGVAEHRDPAWTGIRSVAGRHRMYVLRRSYGLAHCVADARAFGEYMRFVEAVSSSDPSAEYRAPMGANTIPWIV